MISQATFDQLQKLAEEIRRDRSIVSQRSVDICWHWWRVGKALTADPDLYVRGTITISVETSVRVCQALGLSTTLSKTKGRPGGEVAVRRAINTFNRFPDEQAAKEAIEKAEPITISRLARVTGHVSLSPLVCQLRCWITYARKPG
jgi:hypothetical protein